MTTHDAATKSPKRCATQPGSVDRLVHWLVCRSAAGSPTELAARLEEEWLADLRSRSTALSKLRFALGCCWARYVISHDYVAASASPAAVGQRALALLGSDDASWFSRRTSVLLAIAALHVAVFYGFVSGLGHQIISRMPSSLIGIFPAPQPLPHEDPQPPKLNRHSLESQLGKPDIPQIDLHPLIYLNVDPVVVPVIEGNATAPPVAPATPIRRVVGGAGRGFPNAEDYYPDASIRAGEAGVAGVRVCVDATGHLTLPPTIESSTGYPRLDGGALALAKAGSGHYLSSTENGKPVTDCYAVRIRFTLKQ